ncbi:response regulator [Puia sp. P3]|uniref:response regulator n=1 Tax=Puia sp. P3 TaxID=3423952 RepID=UPI003D66B416
MKTESIKIIIIDDDSFAMAITEEIVKRIFTEGQTISFSSAADALKYLRKENGFPTGGIYGPGMILCDLHMPGIDGFMFLAKFAKLSCAVQNRYSSFILSSTTDKQDVARLSKMTCCAGFCPKPLTTEKLVKLIETTYCEFEKKNPGSTALGKPIE